ncbi:MAG: KEOPS complex subunit Pcc1 [Halobacteriota archaeon]|nr:KEOPS complex subunit Pcc1 [Halobacteriota archaeon]
MIEHHKPDIIASSLMPDNLPNMENMIVDGTVVTDITNDRLSSLIATIDDYLMNAKVAEEICELMEVL